MYKHKVSKSQRMLHAIIIIFYICGFGCVGLCVYMALNQNNVVAVLVPLLIMIAMAIVAIIGIMQEYLLDPILGTISFDGYAATLYTPLRKIVFPYMECAEMGFTVWAGPRGSIYYVYLSQKPLTDEQKKYLFWDRLRKKKTVKNMPVYINDYILFQYSPETYKELLKYIPQSFREKLEEEKQMIDEQPVTLKSAKRSVVKLAFFGLCCAIIAALLSHFVFNLEEENLVELKAVRAMRTEYTDGMYYLKFDEGTVAYLPGAIISKEDTEVLLMVCSNSVVYVKVDESAARYKDGIRVGEIVEVKDHDVEYLSLDTSKKSRAKSKWIVVGAVVFLYILCGGWRHILDVIGVVWKR